MSKALTIDLYELTMAQVYFKHKRAVSATFDLFIRSQKRPFYVACGIDDTLAVLENLKFAKEDIDYLKSLALFEEDFLNYLKDFKFKGEVFGVEEPEIVFSNEPILRVTANLIEAQIIESLVLNKINLGTTLATKAARVVSVAKGRGIYDFSLRRTQGLEAALACAKYSYLAGAKGTSNLSAGYLYKIPVAGTMAHSFVMAFEREIESFITFARQFPTKSILLIDTYNSREGLDKAIKIAKIIRHMGFNLLGIRLDSGDLLSESKYARTILDQEGLIDTLIFASGNLDEYQIDGLIKNRAPIDAFGVGTNMGCSSDLPYTDVIYKLVEIKDINKDFIPTMKLSAGKTTLPGKKQVLRIFDSKGLMKKDIIVLEKETMPGRKLLKRLMNKGNRLYKEKNINDKRAIMLEKIKKLPEHLKKLESSNYPVLISKKLTTLTKQIQTQLQRRSDKKIIFLDIDTQYDFMTKNGALYVKGVESIIHNLKKLTNFAEKNNILIISTQDTHRRDDPEFKEFGPHCVKGTGGHKKIKETILKKHKIINCKDTRQREELKDIVSKFSQIILEKNTLNMFYNPNSSNLIELIFPDEIYIYGVATEYCVKEAVEDLIKHHFSVFIIEDAIKELSDKRRNKLFFQWKKKGVEFVKAEAVLKSVKSL